MNSFLSKIKSSAFASTNGWQADLAEIEDSFLLRLLVQLLVTVGIIATDVAATTTNSFWAVPLSLVGAGWSWFSRRQRNILVKFGIAVGMVAALTLFLQQLVRQSEDSRIMLAGLLIQLQVLHSFDLPRRKDLGYSTVIGLILLGVAATLSQTIAFGPFLLVFLAIALPTLILDYRSRLGLPTVKFSGSGIAPKQLGLLLLVVLGLGLTIFAFAPRLPGYQLRTFPVSGQINFEGKFDGRRVINPGYLRSGRAGQAGGGEAGVTDEGAVFDPTFYYGFNSEINQTLGGELTPQTLMRVRSQSIGFWRVMAFDQYTGRGWKVSRNEQAKVLRRSAWNYQFQLPKLSPMGSTKEIIQTYSIVSEFTNLIPALTEPRELYFPSQEVAIDAEGGLRSPITLPSGLTYTVISDVPFRDRSLLRNAKKTYPQRIAQVYLQIPPEIAQPVRQQTQTLLAQAQRPLTSSYEQVLFLTQALKQQYNPQPILPPLAKGEDLVSAFLFKHRGGYPDQYATTLTVMLRSIGIPARLVTGLGPGDFNPFTGLYEVKNTDAYAVAEVYFPGYGWFLFDPAPGHALFPPSVEQDQTFSVLEQFWNWVAGWLPSPVAGWLSGVFAFLAGLVSRFLTLFSSGLSGVLAGVLALISFALLGWLSWNGWRSWCYYRWLSQLAPMEQLYQQMLDWLATRGFTKERSQTPLEFLQQVRQNANPTWREGIANISHAYIGWRYGAQQPDLKQIRDQLKTLRKIPIPKRQKSNGVT